MKGDITKADFAAKTDRVFERLDTNGDDIISEDELRSARRGFHKDKRGFGKFNR